VSALPEKSHQMKAAEKYQPAVSSDVIFPFFNAGRNRPEVVWA